MRYPNDVDYPKGVFIPKEPVKEITEKDISDEELNAGLKFYIMLKRDICEFVDLIDEEKNEKVLQGLYILLATPNAKQTEDNQSLNRIGAGILKTQLKNRNIVLPTI